MSGCLGSAGLPGSSGLTGSSGLAMDLMFTVTCVLISSWPEVRNCGPAPPSTVSALRVAVMVTVWLTVSNAFSLGDCLQRELDLLVQSLQLLGIRYETIVGNTVQFGSGEV